METELKLLLNQQARDLLHAHPLLKKYAVSEPHVDQISDCYFDTPELDLRQHDVNLRVRHLGNNWVQTLKAGERSSISGLYQRQEWETTVDGPRPDLASMRTLIRKNAPWSALLRSKTLERKLKPVFTADVTRTVWDLRLPGGDEIESALDVGQLKCNGQMENISEFELELKSGQLTHLVDFALALQQDIPLSIGTASKAERAYALLEPKPKPFSAVKARPCHLSPQMTPAQAFTVIASNCLAQIQANQAGACQAADGESLHQLRIGLLRLRSAFKLFRNQLLIPEDLQQELAWLAGQLSQARDWDVLATSTLPALLRQLPDKSSLSLLQRAVEEKSKELHQNLSSIALEPRYTKLVLGLTRLLHENSLLASTTKPRRLTSLSRQLIARDRSRIQKRSALQGTDQKARHRLRAAVKAARYGGEFFRSLCKPRQIKPYLKALSHLQEVLGQQNDALVADQLLGELANQPEIHTNEQPNQQPNQLAGSVEFARGYLQKQAATADRPMRQAWKKFSKRKMPG